MNLTKQEMTVLSALDLEEMYGYKIVKEVKERYDITLILGSLYNTLKQLERKGFVESFWSDEQGSGGRRKYYKITAHGSTSLSDAKRELMRMWSPSLNPSAI